MTDTIEGLRKINTTLYITIFSKVMHQSKDSRNQYSIDSVCNSVCLYLTVLFVVIKNV